VVVVEENFFSEKKYEKFSIIRAYGRTGECVSVLFLDLGFVTWGLSYANTWHRAETISEGYLVRNTYIGRSVVVTALGLLALVAGVMAQAQADDLLVDHIAWAVPDLNEGGRLFEDMSGIQPTRGGEHPGWGTANMLVAIGETSYLEIIGPNPDITPPADSMGAELSGLEKPGIAYFAVSFTDLEALTEAAERAGLEVQGPFSGSRKTPTGETLSWRTLGLTGHNFEDFVPYFVDWGDTKHPATTSAKGAKLISFTIYHPRHAKLAELYATIGIPIAVKPGEEPQMVLKLDTPNGEVELRE